MKSLFRITKLFSLFVLAGFLISCGAGSKDLGIPEVTITFYANNGTDDYETQKLESGISSKLRKNTFEYEGYNFIGWSLAADSAQVKYADETSVAIKENLSLYAVWQSEDETATITFWANRNEEDTESVIQYVEKNTPVNLRANSFTNAGYSFAGWISDIDHTSADYIDKASVSISNDINLYALWLDTSKTGTVILHSNTEDDETITLYFSYDDINIHMLDADIFVRDGYRIEGWSEEPDAKPGLLSDNYIQPGLTWITNKRTIHYYCIWQKEAAYTLTFKANYEGAEDEPVVKEFERTDFSSTYARFKIFEPYLFSREGYVLVGWSDTSNTSSIMASITYHGAQSSSFRHDTTLYAVWLEEGSEDLIYYTFYINDENAGTEAEEKIVVPYKKWGYDIGLAPEVFTRERMVFDGWKEVRDKSDSYKSTYPALYQTRTYSDSTDMSYYAIWHVKNPIITFKANFEGSEYDDIIITTNYKESEKFPVCEWQRDGYGFAGWAKDPDTTRTNDIHSAGSYFTPEDDTTYYAIWKKNPVITFHANYEGAEEEIKTQVVPYNTPTPIGAISFTRDGYFFMGFTNSPTSTYRPKKEGDEVTYTEDIDLYAVWAKKRTVIYHSNYKSGEQKTFEEFHPEGEEFYTLAECPFAVPEGYYFEGWADVTDADHNDLYSHRVYSYTFRESDPDPLNVYATWSPYQTVNLISNYSGTGSKDKVITYTIKIGEKIKFTQDIVDEFTAPEGKGFWCFGQNGVAKVSHTIASNVYYELDEEFSYNSTSGSGIFNLYAQWRAPVTITLVANYENASVAQIEKTVPFGTHPEKIDYPFEETKEGYYFLGWGNNENSTSILTGKVVKTMNDRNSLYAVWNPYLKITYHSNYGDTDETHVVLIKQREKYSLPENMFEVPDGKTFAGWGRTPDTTKPDKVGYTPNSYYNEKDVDWYAIWEDLN